MRSIYRDRRPTLSVHHDGQASTRNPRELLLEAVLKPNAIVLAGFLLATSAVAQDGTYEGSADPETGSGQCQPSVWTLWVEGDHVKAGLIPNQHGPARMKVTTGDLQPDGSVSIGRAMSPVHATGLGYIRGKIADGTFEGVGQTKICRYRLTATKSAR
jgi:hypothetical protein